MIYFKQNYNPVSTVIAGRGGALQGSRVGSCLALRNELFKETDLLIEQNILLWRGA